MPPTQVPDRKVYRGDPYTLTFEFKNPDGSARDVSAGVWTLSCALPFGPADVAQAASGVVNFTVAKEDTEKAYPPYVRWDLYEDAIWGRTLMAGRFVMDDDV